MHGFEGTVILIIWRDFCTPVMKVNKQINNDLQAGRGGPVCGDNN